MNNVIDTVLDEKLIVIVRGVESEKLPFLAEAMYKGGIRLLEVTYSANGTVSDEQTADNIGNLSRVFEGRMHIGAGTVLNAKQTDLTANAGGKFIISPDTDADVIAATKAKGLISMPGAVTPTEIKQAHNCGADFVKIFPAVNLGPEYIKAVSAPLSHIRFLAVGGIELDNIREYLKTGVCGFGIGSNIIDKRLLASEDYNGITELAKRYVDAVKG